MPAAPVLQRSSANNASVISNSAVSISVISTSATQQECYQQCYQHQCCQHCTMSPLSTRNCFKSSKVRPISNCWFCHLIYKNICLNVLTISIIAFHAIRTELYKQVLYLKRSYLRSPSSHRMWKIVVCQPSLYYCYWVKYTDKVFFLWLTDNLRW